MSDMLTRHWWVMAIRGVVAFLFIISIAAFVWPELNVLVLALLFGAYALVDGIFAVIAGFATRMGQGRWWALILEGLTGIVIGVVTYLVPIIAAYFVRYYFATWVIVTGILEIIGAIRLRKEIQGEWALALAGIASVIFGILVVVLPASDPLALVGLMSAYALGFGILMLVLAFRLRGLRDTMSHGAMDTG